MAHHFSTSSSLLLIFLCLSFIPFIHSLSTVSISETSNQTLVCALIQSSTQQSSLNCSSYPQGIHNPVSSSITFSGIVAGNGFLCVLRSFSSSTTSTVHCWRFSTNGTNIYKRIYRGPILNDLVAGNNHICGLANGTNRLECWQWPEFSAKNTIAQDYSRIAVGEDYICGLSGSGTISCLGNNTRITTDVPSSGNYRVIAAGFRHACAITVDGDMDCWGDMVSFKPQGKFTALALGEKRSCALWVNGTAVCWGENNFSVPESLRRESFTTIEAKKNVFCGVLSYNYSLYCWGNENINSNFEVFQKVLPGPCRSSCPCLLPGSGVLCGQGYAICQPCVGGNSIEESLPPCPLVSPPQSPQESRGSDWNGRKVAFLVVGVAGSLAMVLVLGFSLFRLCQGRGCRVHDSGRLDMTNAPVEPVLSQGQRPQGQPGQVVLEKRLSQLASMGNAGHLEEFSLQILLQVTNNFSEDYKIGTGSFGTVYHATLEDGREVAIKRAEIISSHSFYVVGTNRQEDKDKAFVNELDSLSRLNHKNLVRLLGFCEERNELVLVYEYMENGSLHDHLHKLKISPLMSWAARIKIALDAARGIAYLHEYAVPIIIHRDIKSSNILLDAKWTAKVSDFGLSLMGPSDDKAHLSLHAAGTVGYMDPEYYRLQHLTTKSDVYSFGVVLLELLSGYTAIHKNENGIHRNVVDFVVPYIVADELHRVLDPKVPPPTPFEIEAVTYVGYLAADCVKLEGRDRPSMTQIVNSLERAFSACLIHQALSRSSTRSSTDGTHVP
ncbi:Pkinase domain-containing protein/RCC1_2 domain-containing protein [Cephalotus follicularis]|uniref:non-specific serine/threonine protein kinase n=1 Tax=Cephalotus follicularis TaxID=3775 RepID=A0A1Q3AP90_CEPFO|nr:Pkinase domain-containing protein/RCC1_2 domain-containing protein [Cephalotus follicularis]